MIENIEEKTQFLNYLNVLDKIMHYVGFLDDFLKRSRDTLRETDSLRLALTREWMLEAHKELKRIGFLYGEL